MAAHDQVWVKVNAQVDSGMAEIVSLLNEIEGLQTIESCQGQGDRLAFVYFYYGDWDKICGLVFGELAPELCRQVDETVSLAVEVFNGSFPLGKLKFSSEATGKVASVLKTLISARRSSACSRDNSYTEPRSSPGYPPRQLTERFCDERPKNRA